MSKDARTIRIDEITIGGEGFSVRPLNEDTVQLYQEIADRLPPVEGWLEPETGQIFLVDGRHRCEARRRAGLEEIAITLLQCERVDAEVRAFGANLAHPLPLTQVQRRWAIGQIVLRRYRRTNNWIAEEASCSPQTVAKIREELEQAKKIPVLDRLERKGGGTTPREFNRIGDAGRTDSPFGNTPDFFDEAEAAEEARKQEKREVKPPANLMAEDRPVRDGGYDVDADGPDEAEFEATGPLITGLEKSAVLASSLPWAGGDNGRNGQQRMLKFAQLNEDGLPVEVMLYVDGQPHSIPVTLLIAAGAVAGLPETSLPDHGRAVLIVGEELGRRLRLLY